MALFFSFDGIDGVGKSTQLKLFVQWLRDSGRQVVECRDPGSTSLGERVRDLVLNHDPSTPIALRAEMLLYMAARAQLVDEVIRPALRASQIVVSDRFLLANIVYQGYAGGMPVERLREVGRIATGGLVPDCTFLLDMTPEAALNRLGRALDRMEDRGAPYRRKLRDGFLTEARHMGPDVYPIAADRAVDQVQAEIRSVAQRVLRDAERSARGEGQAT
jgi:dTMP kinase